MTEVEKPPSSHMQISSPEQIREGAGSKQQSLFESRKDSKKCKAIFGVHTRQWTNSCDAVCSKSGTARLAEIARTWNGYC